MINRRQRNRGHALTLALKAITARDQLSRQNVRASPGRYAVSGMRTLATVRFLRETPRVQEWITAAIGVSGTLAGTGLGAGLGYRGARSINQRQRADAQRARVQDALADYVGALYIAVGELRDLPPNRPPNWLSEAIDQLRGERGAWLARRTAEYRLSGDRYRDIAGRLAIAAARLQVQVLQPELESAVSAANEYAEKLGTDRTPELVAQWPNVRATLLASAAYLNIEA